ncbi:MAG: DUF748 domain-containing protein [Desulfobacter sp.]|nr:DUF748 domain-containing protein [Desulfobacter sp.]WDP86656.1 MAG: DUF748 domain-containing protein [Desulfobacter sp.]
MNKYRYVKPLLYSLACLVVIYSVLGFFGVPYAARKIIVNSIDQTLDRKAVIQNVQFNPYTLELFINGLKIQGKEQADLLSIEKIHFDLSVLSLFKMAPVVSDIDLHSPQIFLRLNKNNRLNISDLIQNFENDSLTKEADKSQDTTEFKFSLANINIKNAGVQFIDSTQDLTHKIEAFNLEIPLLTNLDKKKSAVAGLRFLLNQAQINSNFNSLVFDPSQASKMSLSIKNFDPEVYLNYLNLPKGVTFVRPGLFDLDLEARYTRAEKGKHPGGNQVLELKVRVSGQDLDLRMLGDQPLFSCPNLKLEAGCANLFSKELTIKNLVMKGAHIYLKRGADGRLNLDFTDPGARPSPLKEDQDLADSSALAFPVSVKILQASVEDGSFDFKDEKVEPGFSTRLSNLDARLKNVDMGPEISGEFDLSFLTEREEKVSTQGNFLVEKDYKIQGSLNLENIWPDKYVPYYSAYTGKNLSLGNTDISAGFVFSTTQGIPDLEIINGSLGVDDLKILDKTAPAMDINRLEVNDINLDLGQKQVQVKEILTREGRFNLIRDSQGKINLLTRLDPGRPVKETEQNPSDEKKPSQRGVDAWSLEIGRFLLEKYQVTFSDLGLQKPVQIQVSDIGALATNLSTSENQKADIKGALTFQEKGRMAFKGDLLLSRPSASIDFNLAQMDLTPFEPYFTEKLNILIAKGQMMSKGRLFVDMDKANAPKIRFKGKAALNDFESKNKTDGKDLFKCKSLHFSGMDIALNPIQVMVQKIALTDFYQQVIISKTGQLNLSNILAETQKGSSPEKKTNSNSSKSKQIPKINIKAITLQGGQINFNDFFNQPHFSANMTQIAGSVSGLGSSEKAPAQINLKGIHKTQSSLDITGSFDLFKPEKSADFSVSFKNIELPQFNAYAVKYIGYEIQKGKLILDLNYHIQGNKLVSTNNLFFDQLTLGKQVTSPDATSLPIPLAISLLKNAEGEIDLDLPIQGQLDDPEFDYGRVVVTTFKNLILSVVTAPFKFLGSLVGLGDNGELGFVEFVPGTSNLDQKNKDKIDQLVKILIEKERLNLEIKGQFDLTNDGEQIRILKLKALLVSMMSEKNIDPDTLSREKRNQLIEKAYGLALFPKPRDEAGLEKKISPLEKEKLLITHFKVGQKELKNLGQLRSQEVRDYILSSEKIEPERLFLDAPGRVDQEEESFGRVKTLFVIK